MAASRRLSQDEIYPFHLLDDTKVHRNGILTFTLRFNDVLDPRKLSASLSELLEIDGWRKLGGRIQEKPDGHLEIHVPRPYTTSRPCCAYSYEDTNVSIEKHTLAKHLPRATTTPSIQRFHPDLRTFAVKTDSCLTLQDYIKRQAPMLSLHVTSFTDATIVAISWPHVLMDVLGQQALLQAWSLVLAGKASQVPPLLDAHKDMIINAADDASDVMETFELGKSKLHGMGLVSFGLRYLWDAAWSPIVERRMICLPSTAMDRLRRTAELDLVEQSKAEKAPFVSDGDLLTAWMTHAVSRTMTQYRPITVLHAMSARPRLSALKRTDGTFVQNMTQGAFTFLSADIARGALGPIALENRRQLAKQSTEAQALAFIHEQRTQLATSDSVKLICGPSNAMPLLFTNWTKAEMYKTIDFSPAIIPTAADTSFSRTSTPAGKPVYYHSMTTIASAVRNALMRNTFVVLGKDHDGNYWVSGFLSPGSWTVLEQIIRDL